MQYSVILQIVISWLLYLRALDQLPVRKPENAKYKIPLNRSCSSYFGCTVSSRLDHMLLLFETEIRFSLSNVQCSLSETMIPTGFFRGAH